MTYHTHAESAWLDPKKVLPMPMTEVLVKLRNGEIGADSVWEGYRSIFSWVIYGRQVIGWMPLEWLEGELDE